MLKVNWDDDLEVNDAYTRVLDNLLEEALLDVP